MPDVPDDISLSSLGEGRSTQRLLNVLNKLEAYHANLAAAGGPQREPGKALSGSAITSEIAQLRADNKSLRLRQRHALERLDTLLEKLTLIEAAEQAHAQEQVEEQEDAA